MKPARQEREAAKVAIAAAAPPPYVASGSGDEVSHNLAGQRLGRKGRDTRDRIIAAAAELLAEADSETFSMSAIARRASLGMTSLYNYFTDQTELLLAVLEPVMATAESAYLGQLRDQWPDQDLAERCKAFVLAYHSFWAQHSRLLHLRNHMADNGDPRMMRQRVESTQPIIRLLLKQMDREARLDVSSAGSMATMTMIGIERSVTIATDQQLPELMGWNFGAADRFVAPGARLLELAIRDARQGLCH